MADDISREQARAWLSTVIHPLRRSLEVAVERAHTANWSFRAHLDDFEMLRSSHDAVAPIYELNLLHFRKHRPAIDVLLKTYDERLSTLQIACKDAFAWLQSTDELHAIAARQSDRDVSRYLAEYAINNLVELPQHYELRDFWSAVRGEVRALWATEAGAVHANRMASAGAFFTDALLPLAQALNAEVLDLADKYGVAPVEPTGVVA